MNGDAPTKRGGLATRLMAVQVFVISVGALALAITAGFVGPALFRDHLAHAGMMGGPVRRHAEEAFTFAIAFSLTAAAVAALAAAGLASWFVVRRVARPVEDLAAAADTVAHGRYDVVVPDTAFGGELQQLAEAFRNMAGRLAATDAARSRLLSDLSHELRTPLATLTAYIDGLEDGVVTADAQAWNTMRSQVSRLQRLAIDVRGAATADDDALNMQFERIDLVEVASSVVGAARPRYAAQKVALTIEAPESATVVGDSQRLGQVLTNLLDNALRYTPVDGRVTVRVVAGRDSVALEVIDTGIGIPEGELEAVFERFHRVDPSRAESEGSGSGLGLAIARTIVNAHRGTLTAASSATGSTFRIVLPAATRN